MRQSDETELILEKYRLALSEDDLRAYADSPLQNLGLEGNHVVFLPMPGHRDHPDDLLNELPFDLSQAPESRTHVGKDMLSRLTQDLCQSAEVCVVDFVPWGDFHSQLHLHGCCPQKALDSSAPRLLYLNESHMELVKQALLREQNPRSEVEADNGANASSASVASSVEGGFFGFTKESCEVLSTARLELLRLREVLVELQVSPFLRGVYWRQRLHQGVSDEGQ